MFGCHLGKLFQVTVAGGSYQEGLISVVQGAPPGLYISEQEIYGDLLLRKPGADELSSPRKEPDLPVIATGLNSDDTIEGAANKNHTNGTPISILIPNLDRHLIHVQQYQQTNRTPRPGHASYASFMKFRRVGSLPHQFINFSIQFYHTQNPKSFVLKICNSQLIRVIRD